MTWELGGRAALDARVGAAFGSVGPDFVPWHVKAGARYFLAAASAPLRGFVGASIGYAFVDAKLRVDVLDDAAVPRRLDGVERLGPGFVSARLGLRWVFARPHSVGAALAASVTFPESGFVLGPSIGYAIGF